MIVIVGGAPFSGTTIVAGTLRILGVYFGENLTDRQEDPALARLPKSDIYEILKKRERMYGVVGFKWPTAQSILRISYDSIKVIFCYRSLLKRAEKYGKRAFIDGAVEQANWAIAIGTRDFSVIDFELSQTERINKLCEFLSLRPSDEQIQNAMKFYNKERGYHVVCNSN